MPLASNPLTSKSTSGVFSTTGSLWMGPHTYEVSLELFALNRRRLIDCLHTKIEGRAIILLQGGSEIPRYNADVTYHTFRQESFFMWAFGVLEPDCYGAIDVSTGSAYLFIPRVDDNYQVVWMGLRCQEDFSSRYNIRNVHYVDEMLTILFNIHPSILLTLKGINSDSSLPIQEAKFPGIEKFTINNSILYNVMAELRVFKTDLEIGVLRYVIEVTSAAHRKVMRNVKGGQKFEYQCEADFLYHCYSVGGCRQVAYTCICASSTNGAILHYGHAAAPNDRFIEPEDLCLFDMGAQYFGYCAAMSCSVPASGKFTPDQKLIYEAVFTSSCAVIKACKPGVSMVDMHILGLKTLLKELVKGNILQGDPDAMVTVGLGSVFFPHGIGHLLGLDVHDVGGYLPGNPPRRGEPRGIEKLRTARILNVGMVLTIQAGCYFNDLLLDEALTDPVLMKYMVPDTLKRFRGFGGIRIGENILITDEGAVILSIVPRTIKEIERYMSGKDSEKYYPNKEKNHILSKKSPQ